MNSNHASPLSALSTRIHLVQLIFDHVRESWKNTLIIGPNKTDPLIQFPNWAPNLAYYKEQRTISFPPPSGIHVNMMPVVLGDVDSLPDALKPYNSIIKSCFYPNIHHKLEANAAYLTVHESVVFEQEPQRRPGIHTEGFLLSYQPVQSPWAWFSAIRPYLGPMAQCFGRVEVADYLPIQEPRSNLQQEKFWSSPTGRWFPWGEFRGNHGGDFTSSTVSHSTRIWNATIPRTPSAIILEGCDIEYIRGVLDETVESVEPNAGELYWMTDATPHESLPLEPGTHRQYFRLVVGKIGGWWEEHSTRNPLRVEPDCPVLTGSKFEDGDA